MHTEPVPPPPVKEEPEKIKKWREEQKARLEEKGNKKLIKFCNVSYNMNSVIFFRCRRRKKERGMERSCKERIRRMV